MRRQWRSTDAEVSVRIDGSGSTLRVLLRSLRAEDEVSPTVFRGDLWSQCNRLRPYIGDDDPRETEDTLCPSDTLRPTATGARQRRWSQPGGISMAVPDD